MLIILLMNPLGYAAYLLEDFATLIRTMTFGEMDPKSSPLALLYCLGIPWNRSACLSCRQKKDADKKKKEQNKLLGKNGARDKLSFRLFS